MFAIGIAYVQAAVYNAVVGVKGGYDQYRWNALAHRGTSVDAAVAAAAHGVLVKYAAAAAQPNVEAAYTAALDAIPDGWSKDSGIRFGERAAAHIVTLRTGDGWMVPTPVHPAADSRDLAANANSVVAVRRALGGPDDDPSSSAPMASSGPRLRHSWTPLSTRRTSTR